MKPHEERKLSQHSGGEGGIDAPNKKRKSSKGERAEAKKATLSVEQAQKQYDIDLLKHEEKLGTLADELGAIKDATELFTEGGENLDAIFQVLQLETDLANKYEKKAEAVFHEQRASAVARLISAIRDITDISVLEGLTGGIIAKLFDSAVGGNLTIEGITEAVQGKVPAKVITGEVLMGKPAVEGITLGGLGAIPATPKPLKEQPPIKPVKSPKPPEEEVKKPDQKESLPLSNPSNPAEFVQLLRKNRSDVTAVIDKGDVVVMQMNDLADTIQKHIGSLSKIKDREERIKMALEIIAAAPIDFGYRDGVVKLFGQLKFIDTAQVEQFGSSRERVTSLENPSNLAQFERWLLASLDEVKMSDGQSMSVRELVFLVQRDIKSLKKLAKSSTEQSTKEAEEILKTAPEDFGFRVGLRKVFVDMKLMEKPKEQSVPSAENLEGPMRLKTSKITEGLVKKINALAANIGDIFNDDKYKSFKEKMRACYPVDAEGRTRNFSKELTAFASKSPGEYLKGAQEIYSVLKKTLDDFNSLVASEPKTPEATSLVKDEAIDQQRGSLLARLKRRGVELDAQASGKEVLPEAPVQNADATTSLVVESKPVPAEEEKGVLPGALEGEEQKVPEIIAPPAPEETPEEKLIKQRNEFIKTINSNTDEFQTLFDLHKDKSLLLDDIEKVLKTRLVPDNDWNIFFRRPISEQIYVLKEVVDIDLGIFNQISILVRDFSATKIPVGGTSISPKPEPSISPAPEVTPPTEAKKGWFKKNWGKVLSIASAAGLLWGATELVKKVGEGDEGKEKEKTVASSIVPGGSKANVTELPSGVKIVTPPRVESTNSVTNAQEKISVVSSQPEVQAPKAGVVQKLPEKIVPPVGLMEAISKKVNFESALTKYPGANNSVWVAELFSGADREFKEVKNPREFDAFFVKYFGGLNIGTESFLDTKDRRPPNQAVADVMTSMRREGKTAYDLDVKVRLGLLTVDDLKLRLSEAESLREALTLSHEEFGKNPALGQSPNFTVGLSKANRLISRLTSAIQYSEPTFRANIAVTKKPSPAEILDRRIEILREVGKTNGTVNDSGILTEVTKP